MQLSGALLLSTLHPPIHPVAISMLFGSRESRLEQRTKRFDGMIERLTLDSATLTCVDNVRLRAVLRGVGEAGRVPDVRSSFQILYEDMAPIRMAADLIFPRLEATCDEATDALLAAFDAPPVYQKLFVAAGRTRTQARELPSTQPAAQPHTHRFRRPPTGASVAPQHHRHPPPTSRLSPPDS